MTPAVSVIIPAFNAERTIGRAIDSVLAQQWDDLEVIVCDDGSIDRTADVVHGYADSRVRLVRQSNSGRSQARNRAIDASHGAWIALLDADDWWLPGKLAGDLALADVLPADTLIYANMHVVNQAGNIHRTMVGNKWTIGHSGHVFPALLQSNFVTTSTVTVSRQVVDAVGGFDPDLPRCQDWEWLLRVAARVPFRYRNEAVGYYDAHSWGSDEKVEGTAKGALKVFDAIGRREPSLIDAHRQSFARGLARTHVTLAQAAERRLAFGEAAQHYAEALAATPNDTRLEWCRTLALYRAQEWPAAERALAASITRDPWASLPHFYRGNIRLLSNDLSEAKNEFEQALFILPLEQIMPECVNNLGVVHARLEEPERARELFGQALQQNDAYSDARWNLLSLDTSAPESLRWTRRKVFS